MEGPNRVAFRVDENDEFAYCIEWDSETGNVYHVRGYGDDREPRDKAPLDIRYEIGRKSGDPDDRRRRTPSLSDLPLWSRLEERE